MSSKKNIEDVYPLSSNQGSLLFAHLRRQRDDPGRVQVRCELQGSIDRARLQDAWRWVLDRHPALRSSIHWAKLEKPLQVVHRSLDSTIDCRDLPVHSGEERQAAKNYAWCQLWWSAKEDAQKQWDTGDVTGRRAAW